MDSTLLKLIQELSKSDKKDLVGKALKLSEESGELSKKVLGYTSSPSNKHRFTSRESVLEEVADSVLCSLSVGYDLGFTTEEILAELERKAHSWGSLQRREMRMGDSVPYEIHVTIEEADQEEFIKTCKMIDVKPIILDLQTSQKVIKDVMTSSKHIGNNMSAYNEMKRISESLKDAGFNVLREKIETVPWHSAAPSIEFNNPLMPKDCYFECHFGIKIYPDTDMATLKKICDAYECHLSKNVFKRNEDGSYKLMATYRKYDGYSEDFIDEAESIMSFLKKSGFEVDKLITEFSIYDSKVSHDSEWLNAQKEIKSD